MIQKAACPSVLEHIDRRKHEQHTLTKTSTLRSSPGRLHNGVKLSKVQDWMSDGTAHGQRNIRAHAKPKCVQ